MWCSRAACATSTAFWPGFFVTVIVTAGCTLPASEAAPAGVNPSAGFWTIHLQKEARRLPYYVCQDTTRTLPLKAIRAGFPGTRDTQPLPESGPWKYPIPADKALPLQARLNVEKLGHLLDIFEASDQQAPPFDGGSVDWIENHLSSTSGSPRNWA